MARGDLPIFASDNKMVAMLQSGWAKILNPIIKQSRQRAAVSAACTNNPSVHVSADGTSPQMIAFNAIQGDTDGSMSPSGTFTVKHQGQYVIGANVNVNNHSLFAGQTFQTNLSTGAVVITAPGDFLHVQIMQGTSKLGFQRAYGNGSTYQIGLHLAIPISCQAGDVISVLASVTKSGSFFDSSTSLYILRTG